jgi:hypothetical protein
MYTLLRFLVHTKKVNTIYTNTELKLLLEVLLKSIVLNYEILMF